MLLPFMRFYEAFSIHMDFKAAATQLSDFVVQHKSVCIRIAMLIFDNMSCINKHHSFQCIALSI